MWSIEFSKYSSDIREKNYRKFSTVLKIETLISHRVIRNLNIKLLMKQFRENYEFLVKLLDCLPDMNIILTFIFKLF